jgi:hypothetical protein
MARAAAVRRAIASSGTGVTCGQCGESLLLLISQ